MTITINARRLPTTVGSTAILLCDYWTSEPIREATHHEVILSRLQPDNAREIIVVEGSACITLEACFCRAKIRVPWEALQSPDPPVSMFSAF